MGNADGRRSSRLSRRNAIIVTRSRRGTASINVSGRQQIQAVVPRLDGARRAGRKKSSGDEEDGHRSDNSESEEFSYDDKSEECSLETEGRAADIDRSVQLIMDEKARCSHALRELHAPTHQAIHQAAKACFMSITFKQMYRGAIDRGATEAQKTFLLNYIDFEYERFMEGRQYMEIPQALLGSWILLYNSGSDGSVRASLECP